MKEVWKQIKGYEGYYSVSNMGRIRRDEHADKWGHVYKERILVSAVANKSLGYRHVHLSKDGVAKWHSVHRLVAEAFVPKPDGCDIVNHLDSDPNNNAASNLEWTTYEGNMQHASRKGRMHGHAANIHKAQEARKTPVYAIDGSGNRMRFESQKEAADTLGVNRSHIAAACRKEYGYKTIGGYAFEYADFERQNNAKPKKVGMTKEAQREALRQRMIGNTYGKGHKPSERNIQTSRERLGVPVRQYSKSGAFIAEFPSCIEAERQTGITHIDDASCGKRKTAGGYIWRRE